MIVRFIIQKEIGHLRMGNSTVIAIGIVALIANGAALRSP
jgi:hypothetical protein